MKQEIADSMEWLFGLIKKYGIPIGIIVAIYFGVKRLWFWVIMPSMCLVTLNMLGGVFGWQWITHLDIKSVVISWVFVFGLLSIIFVRDEK